MISMRNKLSDQSSEAPVLECDPQGFAVKEMCEAFDVSRSGFYRWKRSRPSQRQRENDQIVKGMRSIHTDRHLHAYGSPRMTRELRDRGFKNISVNRVARLMRKNKLRARFGKPFRPKTTQVDAGEQFSPNLVAKAPCPETPGDIVVSDITYIATREGWLYLAVVIDLCSRAVLGWKVHHSLEADKLVAPALDDTLASGVVRSGTIFHSDRGCQFTSKLIRERLKASGMRQSMSAKGYCYDNAYCESFFATLKAESFPENGVFETLAQAKLVVFDYLETFYNRRRRHSSLDYHCPNEVLGYHFPNERHLLN